MRKVENIFAKGISYLMILLITITLLGCSVSGVSITVSDDDTDGDGFTDSEETAAGTDPEDPASFPKDEPSDDAILKPDWNVGDTWSMGYTYDLADMVNDMKETFEFMDAKINQFDVKGEVGMYQAAKVVADDADITIDGISYKCYEVSFEQYVGSVMSMVIDMEMSMPDYSDYDESDYYDDEEYYYDYNTRASTTSMKMKEAAYIWLNGDITGTIYYTNAELAVAKGDFEMTLDRLSTGFEQVVDMPGARCEHLSLCSGREPKTPSRDGVFGLSD